MLSKLAPIFRPPSLVYLAAALHAIAPFHGTHIFLPFSSASLALGLAFFDSLHSSTLPLHNSLSKVSELKQPTITELRGPALTLLGGLFISVGLHYPQGQLAWQLAGLGSLGASAATGSQSQKAFRLCGYVAVGLSLGLSMQEQSQRVSLGSPRVTRLQTRKQGAVDK